MTQPARILMQWSNLRPFMSGALRQKVGMPDGSIWEIRAVPMQSGKWTYEVRDGRGRVDEAQERAVFAEITRRDVPLAPRPLAPGSFGVGRTTEGSSASRRRERRRA